MNLSPSPQHARAGDVRQFRTFDIVMAAFVAILLLSNVIGAAKVATVGGWEFGAGILFFPLGYVIGDVLTEVYGYARAAVHLGGLCRARLPGVHELGRGQPAAGAGMDGAVGL